MQRPRVTFSYEDADVGFPPPFDEEKVLETLNVGQRKAVGLMLEGKNVFLTGYAGTGKTYTLNAFISIAEARGKKVAVTATTGIAATHLGGRTWHSWSGIGIPRDNLAATLDKLVGNNPKPWHAMAAYSIAKTDILIVDEISMMDAKSFRMLDGVCRGVRQIVNRDKPFGNLQVILVGDMGQLEPVRKGNEPPAYCFLAQEFWDAKLEFCQLEQIMRQEDESFSKALRLIRRGKIDLNAPVERDMFDIIRARVNAFDPSAKPEATHLCTHNAQADSINAAKLRKVPGDESLFVASDNATNEYEIKRLDEDCLEPKELRIKVGARIMMTKNEPPDYANGTLGYVVKIDSRHERGDGTIRVKLDNDVEIDVARATREVRAGYSRSGEKTLERVQFPMRLAWAITVHKSQGITLDRASVNIQKAFCQGQAYVALSRVRSLEGLNIEGGFSPANVFVGEEVRDFFKLTKLLSDGDRVNAARIFSASRYFGRRRLKMDGCGLTLSDLQERSELDFKTIYDDR